MALPVALTGALNTTIVVRSNPIDSNGLQATSPVIWTSDTTSVATVQSTVDFPGGALIYCLGIGTATITATSNLQTATFALTVVSQTAGAAASISVSADQSFQPTKRMQ
jgi:hypothetical protein